MTTEGNVTNGFQWSHFFSEMDRWAIPNTRCFSIRRFNGATSFQKWIDKGYSFTGVNSITAFQWSHFFSEMDRRDLLTPIIVANSFQWSHFFSEMDRAITGAQLI